MAAVNMAVNLTEDSEHQFAFFVGAAGSFKNKDIYLHFSMTILQMLENRRDRKEKCTKDMGGRKMNCMSPNTTSERETLILEESNSGWKNTIQVIAVS